ncbi:MAG TPA: thioredoxin domain-containing protein [Bryobacteraceae bacterium]|nr:thioredoxin domain-containing protein [Bryobacteraceae bacterium]
MNRLAGEQSPYLLQHAHNPVDWYPWGEAAFEKARRENKPIFLSIGYSTCHWCHVMERESFENGRIAELLNRDYVPIKVDREERPDVDRIYMTFVQASTGSGGWPMSVWLTPELQPFFGGTYFPPDNRFGQPGFASILGQIAEAWRESRGQIEQSARDVVAQLRQQTAVEPGRAGAIDTGLLDSGFFVFRRTFDSHNGGFGGAPKFPRPAVFDFLLRYHARTKNREALEMVLLTLRKMAEGGMHDQLGGGFHRYSVDERWFVPHFEKMLYDQAQLAISYIEAFQITQDAQYATVARRIFDYVLRDMTGPEGGFYSAEDADSVINPEEPEVKGEGAFYIWSAEEIRSLLPEPLAGWFCYRYGVADGGNVVNDPHGEFQNRNILYQAVSVADTAMQFRQIEETVAEGLRKAEAILLEARGRRVRPHLDDKVLTAWNGLMISAFAVGGAALGEERYAAAARRAAEFLIGRMYDRQTGVLLRRYRAGNAAIAGFLDDYAMLAQALLDLYETQFDLRHLDLALELTDRLRERFEDRKDGGFFTTADGDSTLVMRIKDDYDGAEPAGNSIALRNLLRLARFTGRADLRESAERLLAAFAPRLGVAPVALPEMLAACEFHLSPPREIVFAGERGRPDLQALAAALYGRFLPNRIVLLADGASRHALARWNPAIESMRELDGRATAYVCSNYACQLPVNEVAGFLQLLQ